MHVKHVSNVTFYYLLRIDKVIAMVIG